MQITLSICLTLLNECDILLVRGKELSTHNTLENEMSKTSLKQLETFVDEVIRDHEELQYSQPENEKPRG